MQFQTPSKAIKRTLSQAQKFWNGNESSIVAVKTLLYRLLMVGVNFSTSILTARVLGAEARGIQAAIFIGSSLLASLLTLGISRSLIYNVKRFPELKSSFFAVAFLVSLTMGIIAAALSITIFIPIWLGQYSQDVIYFTQGLALLSPILILQITTYGSLEAVEAFSAVNKNVLFGHLLTFVLLVSFYGFGHLNAFTSALAYVCSPSILAIWMIYYASRLYRPSLSNLRFAFIRLINYGLKAYGIDLLSILSQQADQIFVVGLLPPNLVGMYAVAVALARILSVFQVSVVMVLFPKIAAKSVEEVMHATGRTARITCLVMLSVSVGIIILGPNLLTLLYGSEYQAAISVLRLLALEAVISGTTLVLAQAFMALGKPSVVTLLQAVGLILSIPLMYFWVPRLGLLGTGVALLSSAIVRLAFILACFPFVLKTAPPNLFINWDDIRYLQGKFWIKQAEV